MSFINALKWSALGDLATKAIQPIMFVALARLLSPSDFGVLSSALMIIAFSQIFWDVGIAKAIIQYQKNTLQAATTGFHINIGLSIVVISLLLSSAEAIALRIFEDQRVCGVLKVMALQILLGAMGSIPTAILQKDFKFKTLFGVRLAGAIVPGMISIPLALYGGEYWSLVVGVIAGQLSQVIILWLVVPWKPTKHFSISIAKELLSFGMWTAISGVLIWFYVWADSLVIAIYLTQDDLGRYRTGSQFTAMIFSLIIGPVLPVLYSHFSAMERNREKIREVLSRVIRSVAHISLPLAFTIYAMQGVVAENIFGGAWSGIEIVIGAMALVQGVSLLAGANGEAYRAIGKPSYETIVTAGMLVIYLAGYSISIRHGIEVFLWTRLGLALTALIAHFIVAKALFNLGDRIFFGAIMRVGTASMLIIPLALTIQRFIGESAVIDSLLFFTCATTTYLFAYLSDRDFVNNEIMLIVAKVKKTVSI